MPNNRNALLPKFLTQTTAENAINAVSQLLSNEFTGISRMYHVVVLVPAMMDDRVTGNPGWPYQQIQPHALAEMSFGEKSKWSYDFENIARCKALQLWHDRNGGDTDIKPHLLFQGDTPFWGGVKRDGIVVACSGLKPWHDRMVAGVVADICIANAYSAWMNSHDKADDELCFLT